MTNSLTTATICKSIKEQINKRPLISFALVAYKQEQYIREAIQGAFAQTYSPLEIILSDDCSPDGTFGLMEELAKAYQGNHRIVLNHNDTNLGLGGHINRIMELAQGEYIVIAAGDDISMPERTERTLEAFIASDGRAMAVFSDCIEIDDTGNENGIVSSKPPERFTELPEMCRNLFRGITGATNAWHRSVFDMFGPMLPEVVFEDRVIAFRATLLGSISHIPIPLVHYRRHRENTVVMFQSDTNSASKRRMQCFKDVYQNNSLDLETYSLKFIMNKKMYSKCRSIISRRICKFDAYLLILSGDTRRMIAGLINLVINGGNPVHGFRQFIRVLGSRCVDKRNCN